MIRLIITSIITSIGLFFIILYLNLLTMGYSFFEFGKFIIKEPLCWLFFIGLLNIWRVIKSELLLRRVNKYERR